MVPLSGGVTIIMTDVGRAILRTIAYFDPFSYPLTTLELRRWLHGPGTLADIELVLRDDPEIQGRLETQDGFWFLRGRGEIVAERLRRQRIAERKFARARKVARLLAGINGVRLIAVANTLAFSASREEGDIDLFIVAEPGSLWSVRALAAGIVDLLGLRPREGRERDAACLSFLISEDALDLRPLAIDNDVYLAYWAASLVPLYDAGGVYRSFLTANAWVRETLPNAWARETIKRSVRPFFPLPLVPGSFLRRFQERRFPSRIREMVNRDTRVVVSDSVLKFHTNDRREEFRDGWISRCRELGI